MLSSDHASYQADKRGFRLRGRFGILIRLIGGAQVADRTIMRWWDLTLLVCLLASCSTQPAIDERQITSRVGTARSPVLSRDGAIAFAAVAAGYSNPQIWVGRADGSAPPRPLTSDTSQNYDPEFSPDGRSIYFTSTASRKDSIVCRLPAVHPSW